MRNYPELLQPLKEWMERRGDSCEYDMSQKTPMLHGEISLPDAGADRMVLMEVFPVPYGDDTVLLQYFTTMTTPVEGPGMNAVRKAADEWNMSAGIGAYCIYGEPPYLYHRHTLALDTSLVDTVGDQLAMEAAYTIVDEVTRRLPEAIELLNPPTE